MGIPSDKGGGRKPPAELLRKHCHSLTTLLVFGGQAVDRRAVALSFHRSSRHKDGPFVAIDCRREESRLRSALQAVLNNTAPDPGPDPVRGAWCGTLFLDNVAALSNGTQRLLLWFARRTLGGSVAPEGAVPVRLATGSPEPLGAASPGTFIPELFDEIDKISIGLGVAAGAA